MKKIAIHMSKEFVDSQARYYCRPTKPFKTITQYSYQWTDVTCPHCLRYMKRALELEAIKQKVCA